MGKCTLTLKTCLIIMALLMWVAGAGLLYVGAEVFKTYSNISDLGDSLDILAPASVVLATGVFLFIVGSLGCFSAFKESNCCRATFFVLLFILVAGEITGAGLGLYFQPKVKSIVTDRLHYMINNYSQTLQREVDYIQENLKCCGAEKFGDWFNSTGSNYTIPQSCCVDVHCVVPTARSNATNAIWPKGCINVLEDFIRDHLWYIAGPAIAFAVVQVIGLVATCCLMCHKKEVPYLSLGDSSHGYRV